MNFHTGSSFFTIDSCLAVRIYVSLSHAWHRNHVLMEYKKARERLSHEFPTHYTPEKAQQLDQVCRSQWRLQVSISHLEPVLSLFDPFYQNWSRTYRRPRACAERVNVLSLLYILRDWNHNWNVKWTVKCPLHHWNHIMKLIL